MSDSQENNLRSWLSMRGNSLALENYLIDHSLVFRTVRNKMSLSLIMDNLFEKISKCDEFVDLSVWADEKHLKLKQLTRTPLLPLYNLCSILRFSFSEAVSLSNGNSTITAISSFLNAHFKKGDKVMSPSYYVGAFKDFSIAIKQNSSEIQNWYFYTDMETWVGYNLLQPLSTEGKRRIAAVWCKGVVRRGIEETWYNTIFYESMFRRLDKAVMRVRDKLSDKSVSLSDFILNISSWMTDGSSRGVRMNILSSDKKVVKSRAKKQVLALVYGVEDILDKVLKFSSSETYSVSEKIEPGRKKRCIISAPYIQQIRLSYLEYKVKPLIRSAFPEVYFLDNNIGQLARNQQMVRLSQARERTYTMFPLDASSFDQFVSKVEISSFFLALRAVCIKHRLLDANTINLLDLSLFAFFNTDVVIDKKVNIGKWDHGVPSGVRWTALIDSVVNTVRFDVCKAWHKKQLNHELSPKFVQFQGDDMMLVLHNLSETISILRFYEIFMIPIHPYKNFISFSSFEFLRKVYEGEVYGYPARTITKLLFRLPENRGAMDLHGLLIERVNSIQRARNRYLSPDSVLINRVERIIRKLDLPLPTVDWLMSPTYLGGAGVILGNVIQRAGSRFRIVKVTWPSARVADLRIPVTGVYKQLADKFQLVKLPKLGEALSGCLDPATKANWDSSILVEWVEMKTNANFFRKLNLSNPDYKAEVPWMPTDDFLSAVLPDLLFKLEENNDITELRKITNLRSLASLDLLIQKASSAYLWAWVSGRLPVTTFNSNLLIDLSRAQVSASLNQKITSRFILTHKSINLKDRNDILYYSYSYLISNLYYIVRQNNNFVLGVD